MSLDIAQLSYVFVCGSSGTENFIERGSFPGNSCPWVYFPHSTIEGGSVVKPIVSRLSFSVVLLSSDIAQLSYVSMCGRYATEILLRVVRFRGTSARRFTTLIRLLRGDDRQLSQSYLFYHFSVLLLSYEGWVIFGSVLSACA